jgi:hypothetical protein
MQSIVSLQINLLINILQMDCYGIRSNIPDTLIISSIMFQFTMPPHPVCFSRICNPLLIKSGGIEFKPAPAANNAPFLIQARALLPSYVRVPSEFISESHEE